MTTSNDDIVMEHYSSERLSPKLIEQLERLGCEIDSPEETPEPRVVEFDGEQIAVPEAFRQLVEDVTWPDEELEGETREGWKYWMLEFFDDMKPLKPGELGFHSSGVDSDRYLHIGYMDGGNLFLLLDLEDPNPSAPRWYGIDQDPHQRRPTSTNTWLQVLSCLRGNEERQQVMQYVEQLSSEDDNTRRQAIEALGELGPEASDAVEALAELLVDDDSTVRELATDALGRIGVGAKGLAVTLDALTDPDKSVQKSAIEKLRRKRGTKEIDIATLAAVVADIDRPSDVRQKAAEVLAKYGPVASSVTPVLLDALRNRTASDRYVSSHIDKQKLLSEIIETISALNETLPELPDVLFEMMLDHLKLNPQTQTWYSTDCAEALVQFAGEDDHKRVVETLHAVVVDRAVDRHRRERIVKLLVAIDEDTFDARPRFQECRDETVALLESVLDCYEDDLAIFGAQLLARMGELDAERAMPLLKEKITEENYYRRSSEATAEIAASLGEGARPLVPPMTDLLHTKRADDDIVPALARLCKCMPECLEVIEKACGEANPDDLKAYELRRRRENALKVIAGVGPAAESTRETVEQCLGEDDKDIRNAAEQALKGLDRTGDDTDDTENGRSDPERQPETEPTDDTSSAVVEQLEDAAVSNDYRVRKLVLKDPRIPTETIRRLRRVVRYGLYGVDPIVSQDVPFEEVERLADLVIESDEGALPTLLIAQHQGAPPMKLERLAEHDDPAVRRRVAGNPATPPEVLETLAEDDDTSVRTSAAENSSTPPQTLGELVDDPIQEVWVAAKCNPNTPLEARTEGARKLRRRIGSIRNHRHRYKQIIDYAIQPGGHVRRELSKHTDLPVSLLEEFARDFLDARVRANVARNPAAPSDVLGRLLGDFDKEVRRAAAASCDAPADVAELIERTCMDHLGQPRETLGEVTTDELLWLSEDSMGPLARMLAAKHPELPAERLASMAEDSFARVRMGVAQNPATPPEALEKLSEDPWPTVVAEAAANPSLPEARLRELSDSKATDRGVLRNPEIPQDLLEGYLEKKGGISRQMGALANPSAPVDLIEKLAKHDRWPVRCDCASSPACPEHVLEMLADDKESSVQRRVAANERTPPQVLETLFTQKAPGANKVAANPSTPVEVLRRIARGEDYYATAGIPENKAAPDDLIVELAEHEAAEVREAVARRPSVPKEALRRLARDTDKRVLRIMARRRDLPEEVDDQSFP